MLKNMMYEVNTRKSTATAMAHASLSFLTAPLLTLSTSLQVSNPMARVTLDDLARANKSGRTAIDDG